MVGVAFICCTSVAKIKYHSTTRILVAGSQRVKVI